MTDVLVTGAGGNIGAAVLEELDRLGIVAVAADRSARRRVGDTRPGAVLDFTRPETFRPALEGIRSVFLVRPPAIARVGTTINRFLEVAAEMDVEHVVYSSVAGAETNRVVPHHRIEQRLLSLPMANTILRPGFFAQNIGSAYRRDIVERDEIFVPAGAGSVAFIDTRDIAAVAAKALTDDGLRGGRFHLTGPRAHDFDEVAELLTRHLDRPIHYRPASVLGYLRRLRSQELVMPQALVQTVLHVGLRSGAASEVTSTVPDLLGRPAIALERYLTDNLCLWQRPGGGGGH